MSLKLRLSEAIKLAMKSQDAKRLMALRLLSAAVKQREVDERVEMTDERMLAVISQQIKQRHDSITQFDKGGRTDLADKERAELAVLREFMPTPLSDAEVDQAVREGIAETAAASVADLRKVMELLKPRVAYRVDNAVLADKIRKALAS